MPTVKPVALKPRKALTTAARRVERPSPSRTPLQAGDFITVKDAQHGCIRLKVAALDSDALLILLRAAKTALCSLPWPKKLVDEQGKCVWSTLTPLNEKALEKAKQVFLLVEIC